MGRPGEIEFAQLLFGGIGIMVMMALAIVIFVLLYQRKLHFQQSRLHQMEMVHQKKILESIVASQENERERIARDLHDEVGASLSAVRLFVSQVQYEKSPEEMTRVPAQGHRSGYSERGYRASSNKRILYQRRHCSGNAAGTASRRG